MGNNERIIRLGIITIICVICSLAVMLTILYKSAIETEKINLLKMVEMQSSLIRSVARHDAVYAQNNFNFDPVVETFSQISTAMKDNPGFGKTGEILIGIKNNNEITLLMSQQGASPLSNPISLKSKIAEPMRLALSGSTGIITALDYKGSVVIAAYAPLPELKAGLVIKIDKKEVVEPFIRAGFIALLASFPIVVIGVLIFNKVGLPLIDQLEKNISDLKETRQALNQALRAAEEQNNNKSEFLANMSHELRTPLNAIIGFSDMIRGEVMGPVGNLRYIEYAEDIYSSGEHLHAIICDILDLSKIETGLFEIHMEEISLPPLLDFCISTVKSLTVKKNIKLKSNAHDHNVILSTDPLMLKRVIINLLNNAVKFTENGGTVELRVSLNNSGGLLVNIIDSGIGVSEADMEKIFEPFMQAQNSHASSQSGTGLGLPISKQLTEAISAKFSLASTVGKGTDCTLTFPAKLLCNDQNVK